MPITCLCLFKRSGCTDRFKSIERTWNQPQKIQKKRNDQKKEGSPKWPRKALHLELPVSGGDVEGGEAVEDGGPAEHVGLGREEGLDGVPVPSLDRAEELVLIARAGAS